jgi:hypothetical protein
MQDCHGNSSFQQEEGSFTSTLDFNPLNAELNPICHLPALL